MLPFLWYNRNSLLKIEDLGVTLRRPPIVPMAKDSRSTNFRPGSTMSTQSPNFLGASWGKVRGQTESSVASLRRLIIEVWPRKGEG